MLPPADWVAGQNQSCQNPTDLLKNNLAVTGMIKPCHSKGGFTLAGSGAAGGEEEGIGRKGECLANMDQGTAQRKCMHCSCFTT